MLRTRGKADLHVHTSFSDGSFTPSEAVEHALDIGLGAIAITDHDCVDGIPEALEASKDNGLEVIPGVELSAAAGDSEIHLLGFFIDHTDPVLLTTLNNMKNNRIERMEKMISLLKDSGVNIQPEKVYKGVNAGTVGRMHLARILLESGTVASINEAFDRYIGDGKSCSIRHTRLDFTEAISIIRNSGGVPVIAHPGSMGDDKFFPEYVKAGLCGIEASHIKHRYGATMRYKAIAQKYGLIMTAGSDCHGKVNGSVFMGKVTTGLDTVDALRAASLKIRGEKRPA